MGWNHHIGTVVAVDVMDNASMNEQSRLKEKFLRQGWFHNYIPYHTPLEVLRVDNINSLRPSDAYMRQ